MRKAVLLSLNPLLHLNGGMTTVKFRHADVRMDSPDIPVPGTEEDDRSLRNLDATSNADDVLLVRLAGPPCTVCQDSTIQRYQQHLWSTAALGCTDWAGERARTQEC